MVRNYYYSPRNNPEQRSSHFRNTLRHCTRQITVELYVVTNVIYRTYTKRKRIIENALIWITRQCTYKCSNEARSRNHCCRGKAKSMTCSESVFVSLGIQDSMRMRHIGFCGLFSSIIYFHIILKRHDFPKNVIAGTMGVLISCTIFSETPIALRTLQRDTIIIAHKSSCKVPVLVVRL
jgi:hypothetical protein